MDSFITNNLNISGVTIIFPVTNKHQKVNKTTATTKIKQLINFIHKIFHGLLCSHNACTKIVILSCCKIRIPLWQKNPNISGVAIIFHVLNKNQKIIKAATTKKLKQSNNFICKIFGKLLYNQNACTIMLLYFTVNVEALFKK